MLELQEQQHKRIVMLSASALVFAGFATWQLFSDVFSGALLPEALSSRIYLLSCITLMIATIVLIMMRSFQDYKAIKTSELYDESTGLPSKMNFDLQLEEACRQSRPGEGSALVLLDIRRFKSLNHSFGYTTGDEVIRAVAGRLRALASARMQIFKLGADRFAFLALQCQGNAGIGDMASIIQRAMVPPFAIGEKSIYIDLSIGAAYIEDCETATATEFFRQAEFALAEAKSGDGKRHVIYSDRSAE